MRSNLKLRLLEIVAVLLLGLVCAVGAGAQASAPVHAKIDLIAENNTLIAGQTAWIGVLFDIEKGWHIYWVNPGDSGESPRIQWQLPEGFRAGDIRWPTPVRLGSGTVIDYGYEGRVLLPVPLTVAANYNSSLPLGSRVPKIEADVKYLICRDVCIPAKAHVSLTIPAPFLSPADAAAHRELFISVRAQWPKALPAGSRVAVTDDGGHFVVSIETGMREAKATFFPLDEDQIDNAAAQTVTPSAIGAQLTLKKSDQLLKPIAKLRGVVVFGPGRAYDISAPVIAKH